MEQTKPSRLTSKLPPTFGPWLHDELVKRGYRMSQRGGGQVDFAKAAGLSPIMVSRLLRGTAAPDPETLRLVAAALRLAPAELFVRAALLTDDDIAAIRGDRESAIRDRPPITADEVLADLGLAHDDALADALRAIIAAARSRPRPGEAEN